MDPNEALSQLRLLVTIVNDPHSPDGRPTPGEVAREMAEIFDGLDEWLSKGGFLPKSWSRP
jgi:hypothetical protein